MSPCKSGLWVSPKSSCLQGIEGWVGVLASLALLCLDSVTKTNLSVHEDKNRVPFVKVRAGWALVYATGASRTCVKEDGLATQMVDEREVPKGAWKSPDRSLGWYVGQDQNVWSRLFSSDRVVPNALCPAPRRFWM